MMLLVLAAESRAPTAGFCLTRMRASTMAVGCFCLFSPNNTSAKIRRLYGLITGGGGSANN